MRRTSARGIRNRRGLVRHISGSDHGYILAEALLFVAVLTIGVGAILWQTAAGTRELHRQVARAAGLVRAENAQAIDRTFDLTAP
ncbi:MAG TPA: hypothetical protein VMW87_11565 [Spirochaetia bacterium]|nr:hypothetical protein [Spirochaetia bacterium]